MRQKILTAFILFLSIGLSAQLIYNPIDTTYTFSYVHLQVIKDNIESLKTRRLILEQEIKLLEDINNTQSLKIQKLELRDSLYSRELQQYKEMDNVLRETLGRANTIMNNYKVLLLTTENQLSVEAKKARRERRWKQVYKYSYPAAAIIAGIIILK